MPAEKPPTKCSENRRSNKPIMEKRRRARINSCLNDLKALILEALKKDPARHSKLEKADILEMTVKHLQNLQRQQMALATASDPNVSNKFRAGFNECATEVTRYLTRMDGLDPSARQRLLSHLTNCLNGLGAVQTFAMQGSTASPASILPLNVHVSSPTTSGMNMHGQILTPRPSPTNGNGDTSLPNRVVNGLHLVPTRLPNGDFALLLPATYSLTSSAPTPGIISNASLMTETTTTNVSHNAMHPLTNCLSPSGASSMNQSPSPTMHHSVVTTLQQQHTREKSQALPFRTVVKMEPHGDERFREHYIESRLSPDPCKYDYENFSSQVRSEVICKETMHKLEPWRPW